MIWFLTNGLGVGGAVTIQGQQSVGGLTNLLVQQDYIERALKDVEVVQGTTGRWLLFGRILPATPPVATAGNSTITHSAAAYLLGINSLQEEAIGLGRSWNLPPPDNNELYLSRSIVREIGLDPDTATGMQIILRLDLLDVAQSLNVGGIGGSNAAGGSGSDSVNVTISHTQTDEEEAREEAREDTNTPEQNQALLLRLLIERAQPQMVQLWDQPIQYSNNSAIILAFVDYLNTTIANANLDPQGGLQPVPLFPPSGSPGGWTPGDPIPASLEPLRLAINAIYHLNLSPEEMEAYIQLILSQAQIGPAGDYLNNTNGYDQTFAWTTIILDPATIQDDLNRLKNGTETYGQLLDLFSPFLLQLLRIDTVFIIKGIISKPDGNLLKH
jgi:hypothetical protein